MFVGGKILLADDEETFRLSTADLLRREGYDVDCVSDGAAVQEAIERVDYDALLADIKMPGNDSLQTIRRLAGLSRRVPVILMTGYPCLSTAVASVELSVSAYLVKPFEFSDLLQKVRAAVASQRLRRTMRALQDRLQSWQEDLRHLSTAQMQFTPREDVSPGVFLALTLNNVVGALGDVRTLAESAMEEHATPTPCHLLNCPRLSSLQDSVQETISVLEKTRNSFKSRELGELRKKLEGIVP